MAISSSMKSTETDTPKFGLLFRSSLISFHFSISSITYKNGNNFRSLLSPSRNRVDRLNISSYIESLMYPAVVHESKMPSSLAPMPDFITSYCLSPASPSHDAISSHTHKLGLNPSDFFALNAIFFTVELVAVIYRSDIRCFGSAESSCNFLLCISFSDNSSFNSWYSGSRRVICQMLLYMMSAWSSLGAML